MRLSVEVSVGKLGPMIGAPDDPRNGRWTFYLAVSWRGVRWYLARWDSERVDPHRWEWRGPVMVIYAGRSR